MKKIVVLFVVSLASVSAFAGQGKLSKECKRTLNVALYEAHEESKVAIQFESQANFAQADAYLEVAVKDCVEMALAGRHYSAAKAEKVSARVSAMAEQYIEDHR